MMKMDDTTYQLIEDYLDERLDEVAVADFEKRLEEDSSLAEEVATQKEIRLYLGNDDSLSIEKDPLEMKKYIDFFNSQEALSYKNELADARDHYTNAVTNKKPLLPYLVAASLVLIAVFALTVIFSGDDTKDVASFYTWEELPSFYVRSEQSSRLSLGEESFKEKKYDQAFAIFQSELADSDLQNADVYLYLSLSQFELGKHTEALQTLDDLLATDLLDRYKARWYKALIYFSLNEKPNAKMELEHMLSDQFTFFDERAKTLLDLVDSQP
ncbi:MAG: tetratricopeptide repeat protein [Bacteroidota bacterium]